MGYCLSCGDLANTPRCPRCKGKVSGAAALGLSSRDAWSATYLDKQNKKTHAPNLEKLNRKKSFDNTLSNNESNPNSAYKSDVEISVSAPDTSPLKLEDCEKCSKELSNDQDSLHFQGKKYHKNCLECSVCSTKLEKVYDSEGRACCKSCSESTNGSSHSSPILKTPDNEASDSFVDISDNLPHSPENRTTPIAVSSKLLPRSKPDSNPTIASISDKLSKLKTGGRLTGTQELPAQHSPVYSRTFQQLQATVNNKLTPSPSVLNRPRKTSEAANGGLSFADLLASRRNQDPKPTGFSRRPVSVLGVESLNRRVTSSPASNDTAQKDLLSPGNSPARGNRLISRPRPTSFNLGDRRPNFNINSNKFSQKESQSEVDPLPQIQPPLTKESNTRFDSTPAPELPTSGKKVETDDSSSASEPTDKDSTEIENHQEEDVSNNSQTSKLNCSQCQKAIGHTWFKLPDGRLLHKDCFKCQHCQKTIEDGKYSIYKEKEYHTQCLLELSNNSVKDAGDISDDVCDRCRKVIIGPCFTLSNGNQYHPDCFTCAGCKKKFEQGTYISHEHKEYHKECVPKQESVKCAKCSNPIQGVFVTNNNLNYHSECFRCGGCDKVITPKTPFGEINQQHYCEPCLVKQYTSRPSSFAVSAAQKEQRRSAFPPFRS